MRTPLQDPTDLKKKQIWTFHEEPIITITSSEIDSETTYSNSDPYNSWSDTVDYSILRTIRGHQLYIATKTPDYAQTDNPPVLAEVTVVKGYPTLEDTLRWDSLMTAYNVIINERNYFQKFDIIKINKRTLYLSHRTQCLECGKQSKDPDMTGGMQMGFVRHGR